MKILEKTTAFLKEIKIEIKRINWLTRKEIIRYTLIVIGISIFLAFFLGAFDFLFTTILNRFIL